MKTMALIDKVQKLLKRPPEDMPLKKLRKTIKALKQKQEDLGERLKRTRGNHSRRSLQQKIDVLRLQRAKSADVYRKLKAERDLAEKDSQP